MAHTTKQRQYRLPDAAVIPAASERSPNMSPEGSFFVFIVVFILFLLVGLVCVSSPGGVLKIGIAELIRLAALCRRERLQAAVETAAPSNPRLQ